MAEKDYSLIAGIDVTSKLPPQPTVDALLRVARDDLESDPPDPGAGLVDLTLLFENGLI